jgi:hypothetical protein
MEESAMELRDERIFLGVKRQLRRACENGQKELSAKYLGIRYV